MINPMDLTGKKILVTGASSGIGRAAAVQLSRLGAKVIIVARDGDKLNSTLSDMDGKGHAMYSYDLKRIEEIEELVENIAAQTGPLNGFVHSAGISLMRPLKLSKYNFLHDIMLINFYAFVELARCIANKNNSCEGSSFLAISSVSSVKGNKSQCAYSASKAALNGIIKPLAKELSVRHIRVNTVLFGMTKTRMYEDFIDQGGDISVWKDQYLGIGEPEAAADTIAFLMSDASKLITGTNLIADSGFLS